MSENASSPSCFFAYKAADLTFYLTNHLFLHIYRALFEHSPYILTKHQNVFSRLTCLCSIRLLLSIAAIPIFIPAFDAEPEILDYLFRSVQSPLILPFNSFIVQITARSSILSVLEDAIKIGRLTISDSEGTHCYGKYEKGCNDVHLTVTNDNFWLRILL